MVFFFHLKIIPLGLANLILLLFSTKFPFKTQTHENSIGRKENGQLILWIQQNATAQRVADAFPFWSDGICWPFKFMLLPGHVAVIHACRETIIIWRRLYQSVVGNVSICKANVKCPAENLVNFIFSNFEDLALILKKVKESKRIGEEIVHKNMNFYLITDFLHFFTESLVFFTSIDQIIALQI
jgi:hypothetical protein